MRWLKLVLQKSKVRQREKWSIASTKKALEQEETDLKELLLRGIVDECTRLGIVVVSLFCCCVC